MKKQIIAWCLTAVILFGMFPMIVWAADSVPGAKNGSASDVWNGSIAGGFAGGTGTESDPYIIETAEQLAFLASSVNAGTGYEGKNIRLAADLVLNESSDPAEWGTTPPANRWTTIGIEDITAFGGVFDGEGHTVSGIYISIENDIMGEYGVDYQGLFGYNNGTVKNLTVKDIYIQGNSIYYMGGGVVGLNYGTVTGCCSIGNTVGDAGKGSLIGGVVGLNKYMVSNCFNTGNVCGGEYDSGVVVMNDGLISGCYNMGNVSGEYSAGGVVNDNGGVVTDCYNMGMIAGGDFVGGIAGSNSGTLMNCYNTGKTIGNYGIGGIAGQNEASGTVYGSCNFGEVTGNETYGGVAGNNDNGTVQNCCYLDTSVTDPTNTDGKLLAAGQSDPEDIFSDWDIDEIWGIDKDINDGYPYLRAIQPQAAIAYGDANGDGEVDGLDVVRLKKYLANYDYDTGTSTVEVFPGADANGDGEIDGLDVVRLKKYLANYDYDTGTSTVVLGPQ